MSDIVTPTTPLRTPNGTIVHPNIFVPRSWERILLNERTLQFNERDTYDADVRATRSTGLSATTVDAPDVGGSLWTRVSLDPTTGEIVEGTTCNHVIYAEEISKNKYFQRYDAVDKYAQMYKQVPVTVLREYCWRVFCFEGGKYIPINLKYRYGYEAAKESVFQSPEYKLDQMEAVYCIYASTPRNAVTAIQAIHEIGIWA